MAYCPGGFLWAGSNTGVGSGQGWEEPDPCSDLDQYTYKLFVFSRPGILFFYELVLEPSLQFFFSE